MGNKNSCSCSKQCLDSVTEQDFENQDQPETKKSIPSLELERNRGPLSIVYYQNENIMKKDDKKQNK